jgi:hypothetical protein
MSNEEITCWNRCNDIFGVKLPDIFPGGVRVCHKGKINGSLIYFLNTMLCCPVFVGRLDILKYAIHEAIWCRYQKYNVRSSLQAPPALQAGPRNELLIEQFEVGLGQSFNAEQKQSMGRILNAYLGIDLPTDRNMVRTSVPAYNCGRSVIFHCGKGAISCDIRAIISAWNDAVDDDRLLRRTLAEYETIVRGYDDDGCSFIHALNYKQDWVLSNSHRKGKDATSRKMSNTKLKSCERSLSMSSDEWEILDYHIDSETTAST